MTKSLAVLALVLGGCDLYFGGDDQPPCADYGTGGAIAGYELRNPYTGQCEYSYPDYPCDGTCGPCAGAAELSIQNWGACYGHCAGLDEQTCFTTDGCYAAYLNDGTMDGPKQFWGCWNTAPSGPLGGECATLDAQGCSTDDSCIAIYNGGEYNASFGACADEPGTTYCLSDSECGAGSRCDTTTCNQMPCPDCPTCGACPDVCYGVCVPTGGACDLVDCGPSYHCEEQCYPGTDPTTPNEMSYCEGVCVLDTTCAAIDCAPGYTCAEVCEYDANNQLVCSATCVPDQNDPGQCYGTVLCDALPPACPSGTVAGVRNGCWTGYCIPVADCGPSDPGECYGNVTCAAQPPACPSGTVAGVANGCWTGYCIPQQQCPLPACETLSSEQACTARGDCSPVYTGTSCTCTLDGCVCQVLTYDRCESLYMPL